MQSDDRWKNVTDQLSTGGTGQRQDKFQIRNTNGDRRRNEDDDGSEDHKQSARNRMAFTEQRLLLLLEKEWREEELEK